MIFSRTAALLMAMISNGCRPLEVGARRAASRIRSTLSAGTVLAPLLFSSAAAAANARTPAAHPEGYLEAFANIYRNFANHIRARLEGIEPSPLVLDYPKIEDGVRGMAFIDAVVGSSKHNAAWTRIETGC